MHQKQELTTLSTAAKSEFYLRYWVTANGETIDLLSTLKKDNTGYHLKHLFIGSEGTLGVVTKIALQCPIKFPSSHISILGLNSFDDVLKTFQIAKTDLNEILLACEMMDAESINMVETHLGLRSPIGQYPFHMFIGTAGSNVEHNEKKLGFFLERCIKEKLVTDGISTNEPGKFKLFWDLRERFADSFKYDGHLIIFDLSFPIKDFYTIVDDMKRKYGGKVKRISGMGHLGDRNLHLQISLREYNKEEVEFYENVVYKRVKELNGSISAEHGIGFLKRNKLKAIKSTETLNLMRDLKSLMDPNKILNPYKMLA